MRAFYECHFDLFFFYCQNAKVCNPPYMHGECNTPPNWPQVFELETVFHPFSTPPPKKANGSGALFLCNKLVIHLLVINFMELFSLSLCVCARFSFEVGIL